MRNKKWLALAAVLFLGAGAGPCGEDDGGAGKTDPDGGVVTGGPVTAIFEVPRGGPISEFYALPFPNDLRRKPDGTLDLDQHVRQSVYLGQVIDMVARNTPGFGTNAAIFTRYDGEIATTSLPDGPAASMTDAASVYLVDVDPDSPELGKKSPLWFRFKAEAGISIGANSLSALPNPGFPLRGNTTYALVVTNRLKGKDGTPVKRAADFTAVIGGGDASPAVAAARTVYAPLFTWLDGTTSTDDRDDVVSAAVFTTQDPTSLMGKLREVVTAMPAPVARGLHSASSPSSTYKVFEGSYDTPIFQEGDPPYFMEGGGIVVDGEGRPTVQRMEELRFAVSIPKTDMPESGWPVVIFAHGTGGGYRSFINDRTAERMAAEGLAVISIDQVLHGPRDPTNTGADITFVNVYNFLASRDNVRQSGADDFQLVRVAKGLSVVDGQLTHTFNAQKMYFMGHSQGGLSGPPFLAYEPDIKAAVLSGAGSLIYYAFLYKTQPDDVDIPALVRAFVRDFPLDEHNNIFALMQMFVESADPINYAPLLMRAPLASVGPKHIFQSEGMVDHYAPVAGIEALGIATGLSPVAPIVAAVPGFALRGIQTANAPVMSNVNGRTGVFLQYTAPTDTDGHFVIFRVPEAQRQHAKFLGSLARTGMAVLEP